MGSRLRCGECDGISHIVHLLYYAVYLQQVVIREDENGCKNKKVAGRSGCEISIAAGVLSCRGVFTAGQSGRFRNTSRRKHWRRIWRRTDFRLNFPFKNIPTAFRAIWGTGKPTIGMLGECTTHCPIAVPRRAPGATAEVIIFWALPRAAGAVAAKTVLENLESSGQIIYYGCPAEETLAGKVYMAPRWRISRFGCGAGMASGVEYGC